MASYSDRDTLNGIFFETLKANEIRPANFLLYHKRHCSRVRQALPGKLGFNVLLDGNSKALKDRNDTCYFLGPLLFFFHQSRGRSYKEELRQC